ncbi:hypothetical protein [Piscinibacter sp. HJYY11]|uniref:hypothetical protein n=1 Tax=Piscinibacter sp. HJYY11 TaxID=2801333 RepID=UPI001F30EF8F|nr:hypothetical protein [Piscinibacter sp. HJYY11]
MSRFSDAISEPCVQLLRDVHRCCVEQCQIFRPLAWEAKLQAAWEQAGGVEQAVDGAMRWLIERWNVEKIEDISDALHTKLTPMHIRCAVTANLCGTPLLSQFLLFPAVEPLAPKVGFDDAPEHLRRIAEDRGTSMHTIDLLRQGLPVEAVRAESGLPSVHMRKTLLELRKNGVAKARPRRIRYPNCVRYVDDEQRREVYVRRLKEQVAEHPTASRGQMWDMMPAAIEWLKKHDRALLDQLLPPRVRHAAGHWKNAEVSPDNIAFARKRLVAIAAVFRCSTRKELSTRAASLVSWLRNHDAAWFDTRFPRLRPVVLRRSEIRASFRSIFMGQTDECPLIEFGSDSPQLKFATDWLKAHDTVWLNEHKSTSH